MTLPLHPDAPLQRLDLPHGHGTRWRMHAIIAAAAAWVVIVAGFIAVGDDAVYGRLRDLHPTPVVEALLELARQPGNYVFTICLAGALAVWAGQRGRLVALLLLSVGGAASLMAIAIKLLAGRLRPFAGQGAHAWWRPLVDVAANGSHRAPNFSFPSADTTLAFASAVIIAHGWPRWRGACFTWAVLVAIVRLLQHAHFPSDAIAGATLGTFVGLYGVQRFAGSTEQLITRLHPPSSPSSPAAPAASRA